MIRICLALALTLGPAAAQTQDEVTALRAEVAALNKKIDDLGKAVGRANDCIADTAKKIEGIYYGSCPNRRLCGFH